LASWHCRHSSAHFVTCWASLGQRKWLKTSRFVARDLGELPRALVGKKWALKCLHKCTYRCTVYKQCLGTVKLSWQQCRGMFSALLRKRPCPVRAMGAASQLPQDRVEPQKELASHPQKVERERFDLAGEDPQWAAHTTAKGGWPVLAVQELGDSEHPRRGLWRRECADCHLRAPKCKSAVTAGGRTTAATRLAGLPVTAFDPSGFEKHGFQVGN
jgi:hypothetical protein